MTFDQIEYFMSCASCLNFSLAAKYHYVSVSTLSRNISALEEELGVKLFQRGYHGHTLTEEGVRFFDFAEAASRELDDFWMFVDKDRHKQGNSDLLRIACYPFDNMFGEIVECFSTIPPDCLGKKYKIQFIAPGSMIECVRNGRVHMGVAAIADLEEYNREFISIPFFKSRFSLRLREDDPLEHLDEIAAEELFAMGLRYSDFLPDEFIPDGAEERIMESDADLAEIGRISQKYAAELIWNYQSYMKNKYYLLPTNMEIPYLKRKILPISGANVHMEFVFFQKANGGGLSPVRREQFREYILRNIKIY